MSEPDFTHWVIAASVVSDKSVVSSISIKEDTLDLLVSRGDLPTVATNLYKFVRINDAFAARCGCDARTNVGIGDVGFPAYLFRLDPEEHTSKILIATGGPAGITPLASTPGESGSPPVEARASTPSSVLPAINPIRSANESQIPRNPLSSVRTGPSTEIR